MYTVMTRQMLLKGKPLDNQAAAVTLRGLGAPVQGESLRTKMLQQLQQHRVIQGRRGRVKLVPWANYLEWLL